MLATSRPHAFMRPSGRPEQRLKGSFHPPPASSRTYPRGPCGDSYLRFTLLHRTLKHTR